MSNRLPMLITLIFGTLFLQACSKFSPAVTGDGLNSQGINLQKDSDGDTVENADDNCPSDQNLDQLDRDVDGVGDACDDDGANADTSDVDSDTILDTADNCPTAINADQLDTDGDGVGDACDASVGVANIFDTDSDGVADSADNCPAVSNPDQADSNSDGAGDACSATGPSAADLAALAQLDTDSHLQISRACSTHMTIAAGTRDPANQKFGLNVVMASRHRPGGQTFDYLPAQGADGILDPTKFDLDGDGTLDLIDIDNDGAGTPGDGIANDIDGDGTADGYGDGSGLRAHLYKIEKRTDGSYYMTNHLYNTPVGATADEDLASRMTIVDDIMFSARIPLLHAGLKEMLASGAGIYTVLVCSAAEPYNTICSNLSNISLGPISLEGRITSLDPIALARRAFPGVAEQNTPKGILNYRQVVMLEVYNDGASGTLRVRNLAGTASNKMEVVFTTWYISGTGSLGDLSDSCNDWNSPLIVDTGKNGIRLSSPEEGVDFDIDGKKDAQKERISWPLDNDDMLLTLPEGSEVRSVRQLFGNLTFGDDSGVDNGFEALNKYNDNKTQKISYGINSQAQVIDSNDSVFEKLRLWADKNRNGKTESGELFDLKGQGIIAINLEFKDLQEDQWLHDQYGNQIRQRSSVIYKDLSRAPIDDVWFIMGEPLSPLRNISLQTFTQNLMSLWSF